MKPDELMEDQLINNNKQISIEYDVIVNIDLLWQPECVNAVN